MYRGGCIDSIGGYGGHRKYREYVYVYVYVCVCMCVCVYIYICVYIYVCVYMCVCVAVCVAGYTDGIQAIDLPGDIAITLSNMLSSRFLWAIVLARVISGRSGYLKYRGV